MAREEVVRALRLEVPAEIPFTGVVTGFVESAAGAFNLGKEEGLKLVLASEEVFTYMATFVCPGVKLTVEAVSAVYYLKVTFHLPVSALNLKGLNISVPVSLESGCGLEEMGLIIATRFVDRLNISHARPREVSIDLIKEKRYESVTPGECEAPALLGAVNVAVPGPEGIAAFAAAMCLLFPDPLLPSFLRYPGKVVDMVASGEYRVLTAVDERGRPAGGIVFFHRTERLVEFYGPYVFAQGQGGPIARSLLDAFTSTLARTKTIGVVSFDAMPAAILGDFEGLGDLDFVGKDKILTAVPVYYRLLHEDPGALVWTEKELMPFLKQQYDRLVLARDIAVVKDYGEVVPQYSIFSADIETVASRATLRPLWPGADMEENIERHVEILASQEILNILFAIDLGVPWHARAIGPLLRKGFVPRIVVPFAATSDMVIFQYHAPAP